MRVAFFQADQFIGRKDGILAKRTRKTASVETKAEPKDGILVKRRRKTVPAETKAETKAEPKDSPAKVFALAAARLARDLHCSDIVVLDLHGVSPAADFFVIATGTSDRQMRSLADEISKEGRKTGFGRFGRAGYDQAHWILLDYIDVVVHLFTEECRQYYDLEMLWSDAARVAVSD
jgi:ribosome-associated protein